MVWVDNSTPALDEINLNDIQEDLEYCVEVANKFNGLKNALNEEVSGYPDAIYLGSNTTLKDITKALKEKSVNSTGLFKNIPKEIRSIKSGTVSDEGFIFHIVGEEIIASFDRKDGLLDLPSVDAAREQIIYIPNSSTKTRSDTYGPDPKGNNVLVSYEWHESFPNATPYNGSIEYYVRRIEDKVIQSGQVEFYDIVYDEHGQCTSYQSRWNYTYFPTTWPIDNVEEQPPTFIKLIQDSYYGRCIELRALDNGKYYSSDSNNYCMTYKDRIELAIRDVDRKIKYWRINE